MFLGVLSDQFEHINITCQLNHVCESEDTKKAHHP